MEETIYPAKVTSIQRGLLGCVSGTGFEGMKLLLSRKGGVRKGKKKFIPQRKVSNKGT